MELSFSLLPHQEEFVFDLDHRFVAFVGGYGTGKTEALCYKAIYLAAVNYGKEGALMSPTLGMSNRNVIPKLKQLLDDLTIPYKHKKAAGEIHLRFGKYTSVIHLLAAENYERLRGMNLAWVGVDEIDTITPKSLIYSAWEQIQARLRAGDEDGFEQAFCVSTPEGYGFLYEWFEGEKNERVLDSIPLEEPFIYHDRKMYQVSTYDNYTLKPSYIESIKQNYPSNLINAYLNGRFVNLTGSPVYVNFERNLNSTGMGPHDFSENHAIFIGMDFNINAMSAVIAMVDNTGVAHVVDEIYGVKNTRAMIEEIRRRYGMRKIVVCPDASCVKQSSNSDTTDAYLLRSAGFELKYNGNNPRIQDRINTVNWMFCNAKGQRKLLINTKKCPVTTAALLQQVYDEKTGQPDKSRHEQDGPMDALGYFICQIFPMQGRPTITSR